MISNNLKDTKENVILTTLRSRRKKLKEPLKEPLKEHLNLPESVESTFNVLNQQNILDSNSKDENIELSLEEENIPGTLDTLSQTYNKENNNKENNNNNIKYDPNTSNFNNSITENGSINKSTIDENLNKHLDNCCNIRAQSKSNHSINTKSNTKLEIDNKSSKNQTNTNLLKKSSNYHNYKKGNDESLLKNKTKINLDKVKRKSKPRSKSRSKSKSKSKSKSRSKSRSKSKSKSKSKSRSKSIKTTIR
eukprot:TRINITY_DN5922_c2_g1_i1.p1 TRINITY_DN5922_c2_g1~~TRINITY_DN5922_c2_g1_i1.p1  ORF type:complete len:249 (+),score=86.06 TRINITY_DN5922_c2_g1_i1:102-848(+)